MVGFSPQLNFSGKATVTKLDGLIIDEIAKCHEFSSSWFIMNYIGFSWIRIGDLFSVSSSDLTHSGARNVQIWSPCASRGWWLNRHPHVFVRSNCAEYILMMFHYICCNSWKMMVHAHMIRQYYIINIVNLIIYIYCNYVVICHSISHRIV